MDNMILDFLEAYKKLDELCKQILNSDRGISEYLEGMERERQGSIRVACWNQDYKQLKKMRWIRNQLVHNINSFQDNLFTVEDIQWLKTFHSRIMECSDPYSLLYQSIKKQSKPSQKIEYQEIDEERDVLQHSYQDTYSQMVEQHQICQNACSQTNEQHQNCQEACNQTNDSEQNLGLLIGIAIVAGIGIAFLIILLIFSMIFGAMKSF